MFKSVFKSGIRASYNVLDNPTFVSEPWTIYPAKHRSSGRLASVFIFDKTKFEASVSPICSTSSASKNPKVIISECYELVKFSISQLSKFKHPQILTILEVLEETKTKFLFATEPITDSLASLSIEKLDHVSIQLGLLQVSKALQFLHTHGNAIHLNLQPNSIFINNDGDWKLAGFRFLQNLLEISPQERSSFYIMSQSIVPFANMNLNFTAPELIVDSQSQLDFGNDMWSLGCLIYFLYNNDFLINSYDPNSIREYKDEFRKFSGKFYNHNPSELKYLLKNIPDQMYTLFTQILARYPNDRITINQFIESDYFNGSLIKAMWFIDEFSTKTMEEKLIFIKGLSNSDLIAQFPVKFKSTKLLSLLLEVIHNELNVLTDPINPEVDDLITYCLICIFKIGSSLSSLSFQDRIYESIFKDNPKKKSHTFTKLINASVKTRLTIVENVPILQSKLNDKEFVPIIKALLELILKASDKEVADDVTKIKLQELLLKLIPNFVDKIEFPYIKNSLFPMLCSVFKTTTVLSIKLTTMETFEKLINQKVIDKTIVTEQLLPILKNLKSRDKRIVLSALKFFVRLTESENISLDLESSVDNILPQCYSLSFECNDCNKSEFKQFMQYINSIEKKLVDKKLSTLNEGSVSNNFDSLVSTQRLNERTETNIKSEVMKPTTRSLARPSNTERVLKPTPKTTGSNQNKPGISSLSLKPTPKTPLTFGATEPNSGKNTKLLNTLKGTDFGKPEVQDEEFEDFQTASKSAINWDTEVRKKIDIPLYNTTLNSHTPKQTTSWQPLNFTNQQPNSSSQTNVQTNRSTGLSFQPSTTASNFPPGFNANMVLSPSTDPKPKPKPSDDLLDLI